MIPADLRRALHEYALQVGEPFDRYVEGILRAHVEWVKGPTVREEHGETAFVPYSIEGLDDGLRLQIMSVIPFGMALSPFDIRESIERVYGLVVKPGTAQMALTKMVKAGDLDMTSLMSGRSTTIRYGRRVRMA